MPFLRPPVIRATLLFSLSEMVAISRVTSDVMWQESIQRYGKRARYRRVPWSRCPDSLPKSSVYIGECYCTKHIMVVVNGFPSAEVFGASHLEKWLSAIVGAAYRERSIS